MKQLKNTYINIIRQNYKSYRVKILLSYLFETNNSLLSSKNFNPLVKYSSNPNFFGNIVKDISSIDKINNQNIISQR